MDKIKNHPSLGINGVSVCWSLVGGSLEQKEAKEYGSQSWIECGIIKPSPAMFDWTGEMGTRTSAGEGDGGDGGGVAEQKDDSGCCKSSGI